MPDDGRGEAIAYRIYSGPAFKWLPEVTRRQFGRSVHYPTPRRRQPLQ